MQKISAKNAFGLHLIDHMLQLLKMRGEMTNFQVSLLYDICIQGVWAHFTYAYIKIVSFSGLIVGVQRTCTQYTYTYTMPIFWQHIQCACVTAVIIRANYLLTLSNSLFTTGSTLHQWVSFNSLMFWIVDCPDVWVSSGTLPDVWDFLPIISIHPHSRCTEVDVHIFFHQFLLIVGGHIREFSSLKATLYHNREEPSVPWRRKTLSYSINATVVMSKDEYHQ